MIENIKLISTWFVNYGILEGKIKEIYNCPTFEITAAIAPWDGGVSNDTDHAYDVENKELWKFDTPDTEDPNSPKCYLPNLLNRMCRERHLPECKIVVRVSW